jgi:peptide deformylase
MSQQASQSELDEVRALIAQCMNTMDDLEISAADAEGSASAIVLDVAKHPNPEEFGLLLNEAIEHGFLDFVQQKESSHLSLNDFWRKVESANATSKEADENVG